MVARIAFWAGLALGVAGVYELWGRGPALLAAGVVLALLGAVGIREALEPEGRRR